MHKMLIIPTSNGVLDTFSFNLVHKDSRFALSQACSPCLSRSLHGANMDKPFLLALFSYAYINMKGIKIALDIKEFKEYIGASSGGKGLDVAKKIAELEKICGIAEDEQYLHLIEVIKIGKKTVIFKSEYFAKIIEAMKASNDEVRKSFYTSVVKSKICTVRNKASAEIVIALAVLIVRRGQKSVTKVSINKIIAQCPYLAYRLQASNDCKKNSILCDAFNKALELIDEYTYLRKSYTNIDIKLPNEFNYRKLDECVVIRIGGKKSGKEHDI